MKIRLRFCLELTVIDRIKNGLDGIKLGDGISQKWKSKGKGKRDGATARSLTTAISQSRR